MAMRRGMTVLEIIIAVAIVALLAAIIFWITRGIGRSQEARAEAELEEIAKAASLAMNNHWRNMYPADVGRGVAPGLEMYLDAGKWPTPPWTGSLYDWDHWLVRGNGTLASWTGGTVLNAGDREIVQISIRFCSQGGSSSTCSFPAEPWAAKFDEYSAMYYCIEGPCRSHSSKPPDHPGYCINC